LARPATEGVLEVWAGALSLPDAVLVDEASGMHVLPAVVRSPIAHTHEILGSDRMRDIIRKARETYELIVVDLSPLEPVVDVRAIGGLLDSAVFVVEWGRTPQEIVSEAVNHSGLTSEQVLGFVLNKVDMDAYRRFADVPQDYYYYGGTYYGTSETERKSKKGLRRFLSS